MEKRLFVIVTIIMLVVSIKCNFFLYDRILNKEIKVKNSEIKTSQTIKRKQFEMYYKKDGKYVEYTGTTFPEGYGIDRKMSKCYDVNEKELNDVNLSINNNSITVTSKKTAYCRLYLDETKGGLDIIENLPANSGLSTSKLGDMRRYQGSSVKNYICINDTGTKCTSGSDQMYRIIGIVEDGDEAGQIKVIKETKYGTTYKWNTAYQIGGSGTNYCGNSGCPEWPNSEINNTLNNIFLNTLPTKVQNAIVSKYWYYGDLHSDYASITADAMYKIETGQTNTGYYPKTGNTGQSIITNTKWQKTTTPSKVGLMYIHDYAYAANSHATSCRSNVTSCKSSWIHMSQNGNSSDIEWTMNRFGRYSSTSTLVATWRITSTGGVGNSTLNDAVAIRPVFYLTKDINIKNGTGEVNNPYILELN